MTEPSRAADLAQTLVGLDITTAIALARERGVTVRVLRGDGAIGYHTLERRTDRINVAVEGGRVASAEAS